MFTVRTPVLDILKPSVDTSIYAGDSVYFAGEGYTGNAPVSYSWLFGGFSTSDSLEPGWILFEEIGVFDVFFFYET